MKQRKKNVLIFGDSHSRRYIELGADKIQNDIKFKVYPVHGATAQGAVNPHSKTKALSKYLEILEERRIKDNVKKHTDKEYDFFGIMLGEVDCGFVIWYRAKKYNKTVEDQILLAVNNLESFLKNNVEDNFSHNKIIVIGATLPTIKDNADKRFLAGARSEVDASLQERIDCTFKYNKQLELMAKRNNYLYFDVTEETFDKENYCVFNKFLNENRDPGPIDHHFNPLTVAPIFFDKFKEIYIKNAK